MIVGENFLYGLQGGPSGPLAPPTRRLGLRSRSGRPTADRTGAKRAVGPLFAEAKPHQAAADLTREPSRRLHRAERGQARSQPDRRQAYGPPPLVKSAAPCARGLSRLLHALTLKRQHRSWMPYL